MNEDRASGGTIVQPEGWSAPRGYSNAIAASGRYVVLAGQIGWNPETQLIEATDFAGQARQALQNIVTLLAEAGARPLDLVRLTWYILDRDEYMAARRELGDAWKEVFGDHYPAMSVVVVSGLLEAKARLEIEATAVVED